jgi:hypothetical protein
MQCLHKLIIADSLTRHMGNDSSGMSGRKLSHKRSPSRTESENGWVCLRNGVVRHSTARVLRGNELQMLSVQS